jgi:aminoglycoside phosphotransferase (APT) family kinase protein
MMSQSESPPAPEALAAALASSLGTLQNSDIADLRRLTGGASRETWEFTACGHELILRRDPPGRPSVPGRMRLEADAMRACSRVGLRVPEVLAVDGDGAVLGTPALVMRRVAGETIPRRILRNEAFASARGVLVGEFGRFLAGLHAIDPADLPAAQRADPLANFTALYERSNDRSRTFEKAHVWLVANRPGQADEAIVHGDFRLGNVIVDPNGLAAVIDWELVHLGDPLEDLAWLCIKAWRFGGRPEAAGLGSLDELIAAYESSGGRPVDRAALHWWLVQKTLLWGVGCMVQGDVHLSGKVRSVELAAVGRRVAEQEWDLLELLAPQAWRAAATEAPVEPQHDQAGLYGRPTARELLEAVREFLNEEVLPHVDGGLAFRTRVAANVLDIVDRELAQQAPAREGDDWPTLAAIVRDRLAVANPQYLARSIPNAGRHP